MKGFIIFEDFIQFITCEEILDGDYKCVISDYPNGTFSGIINRVTGASCTPKDTYDFERGALISLMKMCGFDKSYKAIEEAFRYNSYDAKKNKELEEENSELKKRINELEIYNNQLEDRVAGEQRGGYKLLKDMEKLEEENEKLKNESMHRLRDKLDLKEKYVALIAENEKLKLDCEKLQHGYIDTDMMFCGGRTCGKQYKALVELFKKLSQDKVDAAYKEAYGVKVISVAREALDSLLESCKYGILTDKDGGRIEKWTGFSEFTLELKVPTKREEMWAEIFELHKESDVVIKVKKEDVNTFLHEIEKRIPEITWASWHKIFEAKNTIKSIYRALKTRDAAYFILWKENKISYASNEFIYAFKGSHHIDYLPPMRWDLFKKGRLVVGVRKEHYDKFILNATEHIYRFNKHKPYDDFNYSFFIFDKNAKFIEAIGRSQFRQIKEMNNHKVIYWEDVR